MSTQKSEYLLLFRGDDWAKGLSPEELQKSINDFMAWFERLKLEGKCKGGQPLERRGKVVTRKGVSDGPFAESKEAVGGYFALEVSGMDEAVAIANQCPSLKYGLTVEVRPVADMCPLQKKLDQTKEPAAIGA